MNIDVYRRKLFFKIMLETLHYLDPDYVYNLSLTSLWELVNKLDNIEGGQETKKINLGNRFEQVIRSLQEGDHALWEDTILPLFKDSPYEKYVESLYKKFVS